MAEVSQHELLTLDDIARLLGKTKRQINNYINNNDLPSQGEGKRRTFIWPDVLDWYVGYRISIESGDGNGGNEDPESGDATSVSGPGKKEDIRGATLRKTRAEAHLKELALSRQRGEVITIADAKVRLDRMFGNLRTKLLTLAPGLAARLEAESSQAARELAIKREMEALCTEIATGAIIDEPKPAADKDTADVAVEP